MDKYNTKVTLAFNSNDELIWIYEQTGENIKKSQVSDDAYTGGTSESDITRNKVFGVFR